MADPAGDKATTTTGALPTLEDLQHWTWVAGRAQQMMLTHAMEQARTNLPGAPDWSAWMRTGTDFWNASLQFWQQGLAGAADDADDPRDKRFAAPEWRDNPIYDTIRQSYQLVARQMLAQADALPGLDDAKREQVKFNTRAVIDAMHPSNFALTNPVVMKRAIETKGDSLLTGLRHMLADMERGQLRHVAPDAFELGRNIATTPGKVVHEGPLYQLIQYTPRTETVMTTPLVIFPPWINRFYILDLNEEKSFVRWCLDQGISVFMVSWKSADATTRDVVWDDYVAAQIDAIDTIRDTLDVPSVNAIGYCVAGTTLAATLSVLAARGEADKVRSATFFTAQVDFDDAGELKLLVDDAHLAMIDTLSAANGYLDGRYMVATFNALRSRDLIWNYVVNNYLMGADYPAFDLLHWNGDSTNLPAKWHRAYLTDLYRENRLVQPGALSVLGVPIDLNRVQTPAYIQAGREDHIAPPQSVFKLTRHLHGPVRFVLAGSGHIAGVVNPPSAGKYQYWTGDHQAAADLDAFAANAIETKGSWWPDWHAWLTDQDATAVPAKGARKPGKGKREAIEDAPGRYVRE